MDKIEARNLKPGHEVKLKNPIPNLPGSEYGLVTQVEEIDPGITVPIVKISFARTTFALCCDGDREFEVRSSAPTKLWTPR